DFNTVLEDSNATIESGFLMNLNYERKQSQPALMLKEVTLINPGEIFAIVALPGTGKSMLMEFFISVMLAAKHNIDTDTGGFNFILPTGKNALYIDAERTHDDCRDGFDRIYRRLNIHLRPNLLDNDSAIKGLNLYCFIELETIEKRRAALELHIENGNYAFVIIDGILEFSPLNDEIISAESIRWIRALANKPGKEFAVILTMHPNKGTETMAGHLGAFLYRYCRACFIIKKHEYNPEIKLMTNNFPQGKLSHGGGEVRALFKWCDEKKMLMPVCDEPEKPTKNNDSEIQIIKEIFNEFKIKGQQIVPASKLKQSIMEKTG